MGDVAAQVTNNKTMQQLRDTTNELKYLYGTTRDTVSHRLMGRPTGLALEGASGEEDADAALIHRREAWVAHVKERYQDTKNDGKICRGEREGD